MNNIIAPNHQTPASEAIFILATLENIYSLLGYGNSEHFFKHLFDPLADDKSTSGIEYVKLIKNAEKTADDNGIVIDPEIRAQHIRLALLFTACAYSVQTLEIESNSTKNSDEAWNYIIAATHWLGILQGLIFSIGKGVSIFSQRGLDETHKENRAMKAEVFEWLDKNRHNYGGVDDIALAIAGNIVPIKLSTARTWIGLWAKKKAYR